jgi:CheY-like chemotaxis protein/anti-sigma regulatory factor (Ser/Thr protein kinase)
MPNILLVEDSATQAMQMKILLESAGHAVHCAEDGQCAMQCLADAPYELVVTDLEMPLMTGLELVERMRSDFPHVPSVLVTARGSEKLAAEALQRGASAYVPKSLLESLLLKTVEDVLGVLRTDQTYARMIDCAVQNHFVLELPSEPEFIGPAVDLPLQIAAGMELLTGNEISRLSTAIREAMSNALYRGNLELTYDQWQDQEDFDDNHLAMPEIVAERLNAEPYKSRKIRYDVLLTKEFIRVVITDRGPGFDTSTVPAKGDPNAMSERVGRGLISIQAFMDKVEFNDTGNQITMTKYCQSP